MASVESVCETHLKKKLHLIRNDSWGVHAFTWNSHGLLLLSSDVFLPPWLVDVYLSGVFWRTLAFS